MINDKELLISNKSYINKDFGTIYPELLDNFVDLTKRYDPTTANESDPMLVILKLAAFVADKTNYNIDKNILEAFMPSATQESSMRDLCARRGYTMKYYIAPTTEITLMYNGDLSDKELIFKPLSTSFTSAEDENPITYYLVSDETQGSISLNKKGVASTGKVMQGKLKQLKANTTGDETSTFDVESRLHLVNLDDNNRLYFPETNVAQNGVFVSDNLDDDTLKWKSVDNLNYYSSPDPCFKFGYDSTRGLPYIEFPNYISAIIGDGIYVRYIVTDGVNGNVAANVLTKLNATSINKTDYADSDEEFDDNLYIRNASAASNGADPETIDEAYNNFKKLVGTFDTLVTCRDYANAIYNLVDASDYPFVSNVQVCDRRDDYNYAVKVVSFNELGQYTNNETTDITSYDLCCYPLYPVYTFNSDKDYNKSYTPLTTSGTLPSRIQTLLEDSKSICHTYKTIDENAVYAFINKLGLTSQLITAYKVDKNERLDIIKNVKNNLMTTFNARNVDYGYEIPYDSILKCIKESDERISQVILNEPNLTTYVLKNSGESSLTKLTTNSSDYVNLLAKNILSGRISLFDYDDDFDYDLGQMNAQMYKNIKSISSHLDLTFGTASGELQEYELKKNEFVQILTPNMVNVLNYGSFCYYRFECTGSKTITANSIYTLQQNEILYMSYTDSNNNTKTVKYEAGVMFTPNGFSITSNPLPGAEGTTQKDTQYGPLVFNYMTTGQTLDIKKINTVTLKEYTNCYWLLDDPTNTINWDNNEYILNDGEYFFYTDSSKTQLISLGSGTTLIKGSSVSASWSCERVELEDVLEQGLNALDSKWKLLKLSSADNNNLTIQENSIITIGEKNTIKITDVQITLDNTFQPIFESNPNAVIEYTIDGDSDEINANTYTSCKIRSRLDINVTKEDPQEITEHEKISIVDSDNVSHDFTSGCINLNADLQLVGKDDIELKIEDTYPYSLYNYDIEVDEGNPVSPSLYPGRDAQGYATYQLSDIGDGTSGHPDKSFTIPFIPSESSANTAKDAVMLIYVKSVPSVTHPLTISLSSDSWYHIKPYNAGSEDTSLSLVDGVNIVHFVGQTQGAGQTLSETILTIINDYLVNGILILGTLDFFNGLNEQLNIPVSKVPDLMNALRFDDFYYNCKIENDKAINVEDMSHPLALYDVNNYANKLTISQIDFSDNVFNVDVIRSSRK